MSEEMPGTGRSSSTELAEMKQAADVGGWPGDVVAQRMPMMSDDELTVAWKYAKSLSVSSMFKDARQAEQAFAKILLGRDLGLTPQRAMAAIQFVEGGVQIHYRTLLAFVRENGYDYQYPQEPDEDPPLKTDLIKGENPSNDRVVIDFYGRTDQAGKRRFLGRSRFSQADAATALLDKPTSSGKPSNYVKYPRNMLVARATSNGIGWYCPEVLGGIPVYTEGEIPQPSLTTGEPVPEAAAPVALPESLEALLKRVHDIDSMAFRKNEVRARLPLPDAEGYEHAVTVVFADISEWLASHEVTEADVVDGAPADPPGVHDVLGPVPAEGVSDAVANDIAAHEAGGVSHEALLKRYAEDADWRALVEPLLNRRAELEAQAEALDPNDVGNHDTLAQFDSEINALEDNLREYGVPGSWLPVSSDQTTMEV